jgi:hypothetical protein
MFLEIVQNVGHFCQASKSAQTVIGTPSKPNETMQLLPGRNVKDGGRRHILTVGIGRLEIYFRRLQYSATPLLRNVR